MVFQPAGFFFGGEGQYFCLIPWFVLWTIDAQKDITFREEEDKALVKFIQKYRCTY